MLTPETIWRNLSLGERLLRETYGVTALWVFGPAARPDAGPVAEADLLIEAARPLDVALFIALRRDLEALLDGLRVEPVLRPALVSDEIKAMLADARRVF